MASGLNGRRALQFAAATTQTLTLNVNFPAPVSIFYVARQTGAGNRGRILSGLNNNWLLGWWNGQQDVAYFDVRSLYHDHHHGS